MNYVTYRIRIALLLGIYYLFHRYVNDTAAFMVLFWFIMGDISDIEAELNEMKEGRAEWKNFLTQRKGF
jgi:hypothetical protein